MGLFHHNNNGAAATTTVASAAATSTSSSGSICPPYPSPLYATEPISGSLTFQRLAEYIGGIAAAVALVVSLALILMHATHFTRPVEQTKIMRIIAVIPIFAVIYFGVIFLGESAIYLSPWANVFEAMAILSLFHLLHAFWQREQSIQKGAAAPLMDYEQGKMMPPMMREGAPEAEAHISSAAVRRTQIFIGQYVLVAIVIAVATDALQAAGRFCKGQSGPKYGAFWMTIIRTVSVGAAVVAVLRFNGALKPVISSYGTMKKIIGFKAIVGLNVLHNLVFTFIGSRYTPSASFAYLDLTVSLAGLLSCVEMAIFAFLFHFIYKFTPYSPRHETGNTKQMGAAAALVAAFSPIAVVRDALRIGSQ